MSGHNYRDEVLREFAKESQVEIRRIADRFRISPNDYAWVYIAMLMVVKKEYRQLLKEVVGRREKGVLDVVSDHWPVVFGAFVTGLIVRSVF